MKMTPTQLYRKARRLFEQKNLSCAEIGRQLGVTRQRIHQIVTEYDLRRPNRLSREARQKLVAALMRKGVTNSAISEQLGISLGSLQALLISHPDYEQLKFQRKKAKKRARGPCQTSRKNSDGS